MFSNRLKELSGQFLLRTREELTLLCSHVPQAQLGDRPALQEMQRFAHRICGSGAMLGFKVISEAAGQVERILRRAEPVPTAAEWQDIARQLQIIDADLSSHASHQADGHPGDAT